MSSYTLKAPFATEPSSSSSTTNVSRRPNFQYDLSDIEKAHSISYVSRLHQNPRSPLDPIYQLPHVEERPITPPRFIRDTLNISDIERARSRDPYLELQTRPQSSLQCRDINGAAPVSRYRGHARTPSTLKAKDITHTKFISTRHCDPLDPVYAFGKETSLDISSILGRLDGGQRVSVEEKDGSGQVVHFGQVEGAKPRTAPRARQPENVLNLRTYDISAKEAQNWSWQKPQRTQFREVTNVQDVPGAQPLADKAKIYKTKRHTNPNTRDYGPGLGGFKVSDQAGMVHVHRHVLDDTPYASMWKPAFGEPAPDAAGVSLWRTGNFTAGMQPPRTATKRVEVAQTESTQAEAPAPRKVAFGEPAEAAPIRDEPIGQEYEPATQYESEPSYQQQQEQSSANYDSEPDYEPSPDVEAEPTPATSSQPQRQPSLSYPINSRKPPQAQKRHKKVSLNNILAHPPSNGRECVAADPASRLPVMLFGVRGPYSVSTEKASIAESQAASVPSSQAASRANSRPNSRTQMMPYPHASDALSASTKAKQQMAAFSPTASTLSNAFSLAFVPTSTTALPTYLPHSSPLSRPGLGTVELFERKPIQGGSTQSIAKMHARKLAAQRTAEIKAVRALG